MRRKDEAVNFGAAGAMIGHEMSHGFDDSGRRFDAKGNLTDWWTPRDDAAFRERARRASRRSTADYASLPGATLNGNLTLGENVADNAGLRIAYYALMEVLATKGPPPAIDGFTPEQRFFIAWGQVWCENATDQDFRRRAQEDVHASGRWRANGVLQNMPEFRKAFGCGTARRWRPPTCVECGRASPCESSWPSARGYSQIVSAIQRAPAALGCTPSSEIRSGLPSTPFITNGTSGTPFFAARSSYILWKSTVYCQPWSGSASIAQSSTSASCACAASMIFCEVRLDLRDGHAAQAVVDAELDDQNLRLLRERADRDAAAPAGGVARHAFIDHGERQPGASSPSSEDAGYASFAAADGRRSGCRRTPRS